ncbi:hypothetical protein P4S95_27930 [Aneurinibacillus aneurinilyticus]|uniref:hypothetical protein n=1 Tax=Aneurinibacillus aneurinilyticus TaxID=1391 RepID=UPI002E1F519C|nr:hypothetical protein [Aneurinibacillus aneurinilyticus]
MAMTRQELQELINKLPDNKIDEVGKFVKSIYGNNNGNLNEKFIPTLNKLFDKYDETMKGLVDR